MNFNAIVIVGIFIPFIITSADKNNITITERGSWMSSQKFSTIIDESLNRSRCSNVYVSGDSVAIRELFNDFVNNYQYGYMKVKKSYRCKGYFMISQSANNLLAVLKIVPMKSPTEILIIVDDNTTESSLLFNVSMYKYANVNIATRNGMWKLSENYLQPRNFKKYSRFLRIVRKRGFVNLQGRQLRATAYHKPPFCYLKSTVNRIVEGINTELFVTSNTSELEGVEVKLFLLMAERLNFTWTIRKPNDNYRYGDPNGTVWHGGMIGQIFNKEVDIAFTNIWLELNKSLFVNMTRPWTKGAIHFLVPRPKPYRSFWALIKPFSLQLWLAIIVMLIAQSIYVYVKAWAIPNVPKRFRNFVVTFTELIGLLLGVWSTQKIEGLKVQLQFWQFIGILLVTSYSTNLAARLASFGYEKRIDTLEDFISANLTWGRETEPLFTDYFDETDPYGKLMHQYFHLETNETERHEKILKGNYAIFGKIIGEMFFPDNDIRSEDLKHYRLMQRKTMRFYGTFVVQPWLLEPIDEVILRLREAGLAEYHLDHVIYRNTGQEYREIFVEHDTELNASPRVLTLIPLGAAYLVFFIGLTISFIVFCIELKHVSGKKSIIQILRQIKHNRDIWNARKITKRRYPMLKSFKGPKYGFPLP